MRRELISGPVEAVPLILDQPEEGKISLDLLLRPFIGAYVRITIETLDEETEDAEEQRNVYQQHTKFSDRGRRGD